MKKRMLLLTLILALVLGLIPGAIAADGPSAHVPYDGYLVSVRSGASPRLSLLSAGVEEIADDLFLASCLDSARRAFRDDQIVHIEPNFEIVLFNTPNDPFFNQQWCMVMINAPILWELGIRGAGVRVGIIDSGITRNHEDLDPRRVAAGFNYLGGNTDVTDTYGHGTEAAGIIVATRNNGRGIAGLVDQVTIVPLRVFDRGTSNVSYAIQAINDAVDYFDVDVLNLSWGIRGGATSRELENVISRAVAEGVIVVAAAGNDGNDTMVFPAAFSNVVSVGAVDRDGSAASFSQRNEGLTVVAPGVDVPTLSFRYSDRYVAVNGTSFSAPFVAGMAAVARSVNPDMNQAQFMELLRQSAVPRGSAGFNTTYGHGMVDLNRFLALLPGVNWFNDISGHWARGSILQVADLGLFGGVGGGSFGPEQTMTRAMFVTVLGRLYRETGGNIPQRNDSFTDTERNVWYSPYVAWAAEQGIVTGLPGNRFGPYDPVTREQAATFLARFADHIGAFVPADPNQLNQFVDAGAVADWARGPMAWTAQQGIITGVSVPQGMALRPEYNSTRAEVAVVLQRFMGNIGVAGLDAAA